MKKTFYILMFFMPAIVFGLNITVPQAVNYGDVLVGNVNHTYDPMATSTLGISSGNGLSFSYPFPNNSTSTTLTFSALQNFNYSSTSLYASFLTASTTNLIINGQLFNNLLGSGLKLTSGALTLNNSGDWAGTWQTFNPSHFQTALGYTPLNQSSYFSTTTQNTITTLPVLSITKSQVSDFGTYLTQNSVATGTTETISGLAFWTTTAGSPAKLGSVSTSTLSASSPLTGSFIQIGNSGSLGIQVSTNSQNGYLSSGDHVAFLTATVATTTFGNGLTYTLSTNQVGCNTASASVFGCLTASAFSQFNSATSTFTSPLIYTLGTNAVTCQVASNSSSGCISAGSFSKHDSATTTFSAPLVYTLSTNAVTCTSSSNSVTGCLTSGDHTTFLTAASATTTFGGGLTYTLSTNQASLNLGNSNTWTVNQSFNYSSSTLYSSFITASSTNLLTGGLTFSTTTVGTLKTNSLGLVYVDTTPSSGLPSYDAWTHPAIKQSATTSLMLFNGQASSTLFSAYMADLGGIGTTTFTNSGLVGIGSSTPFALLSLLGDLTKPLFQVSTSTQPDFGQLITVQATTTVLKHTSTLTNFLQDIGVRIGIGLNTYLGYGLLDHFVVNGRVNTQGWLNNNCDTPVGMLQISSDGSACDGFYFAEDGVATLTASTTANKIGGYQFGQLSSSLIADGTGVWVNGPGTGWIIPATTTPVMEVTARINLPQFATTSEFVIGYSNVDTTGASIDVEPTSGCFFEASSTQANWRAVCRTALGTGTYQNTGIASTTVGLSTGGFYKFRIEMDATTAYFYVQKPNGNLALTNQITHGLTTQPLNAGIYYFRSNTVPANITDNFDFFRLRFWWRDFVPAL